MKVAIFLNAFFNALKKMLLVVGVVLYLSESAQAGKQKSFDKYDPPSDLILTLPDLMPVTEKFTQPSAESLLAVNHSAIQSSAIKKAPVNLKCDVDVIQNTVVDVPLSSRIFGECGFNYHY